MDLSALQRLLDAAAHVKVACVGDLMLDRYVHGHVTRISPEAPVPVLVHASEQAMPGGAGNVARGVAALGAAAVLAGAVGEDDAARELERLFAGERAAAAALVAEAGRRTAVKTRFVSAGQQLLRLDSEDVRPIAARTEDAVAGAVEAALPGCGALLVSDYAKGVVTPGLMRRCRAAAARAGAPVVVDPKGRSFAKYGPVALIKPNAAELALVADRPTQTDAEVEAALVAALNACEADAILVTRAERGMTLAARGGPIRHVRAEPRAVFDVSGAGDTVLAALGTALAAKAPLEDAVALALLASGVAVGKAGTAVVTPADLVSAVIASRRGSSKTKVMSLEQALRAVEAWRAQGLKVGFTNGCFDILHAGHVSYLAAARAGCDRLVVAINADASVRRLKGEGRPVNALESRAAVMAGLATVDLVVPFDAQTPIDLIRAVRPDVLLKGADYTREGVVGHDVVEAYGGEVRLVPLVEGYSTTAAIRRMAEGGIGTKDAT